MYATLYKLKIKSNNYFLIVTGKSFHFIVPVGQNASLKGHVADAVSNEPLPFVNILVSGTTIGTTTDADGNFLLTGLTPGFIRIEASFVGYKNTIIFRN